MQVFFSRCGQNRFSLRAERIRFSGASKLIIIFYSFLSNIPRAKVCIGMACSKSCVTRPHSRSSSVISTMAQQHNDPRKRGAPAGKPQNCRLCGTSGHKRKFSYPISDSDTMLRASRTAYHDGSGCRGAAATSSNLMGSDGGTSC
jgi:hypothetical protein